MDIQGKRFVVLGGAGLIGSHTVDALYAGGRRRDRHLRQLRARHAREPRGALTDPRVAIFEVGGDILQTDILDAALEGRRRRLPLRGALAAAVPRIPALGLRRQRARHVQRAGGLRRATASSGWSTRSSASVYGDAVEEPMTEDHPFNNKNFYGATKICGEAMARALHHRYGLDYVGLRYMNVYGPRQDYHGAYIAVIMKMLDAHRPRRAARSSSATAARRSTSSTSSDCAEANVCAMRADATDRFYNVGTGKRTSLKELAEMLLEITGSDVGIHYEPERGHVRQEPHRLRRSGRARRSASRPRIEPRRGPARADRMAQRRTRTRSTHAARTGPRRQRDVTAADPDRRCPRRATRSGRRCASRSSRAG